MSVPVKCPICNNEFLAARPDQQFCSNACRQKNYRQESRLKATGGIDVDQLVDQLVDGLLAEAEQKGVLEEVLLELLYRQVKSQLDRFPRRLKERFAARLLEEFFKEENVFVLRKKM
ncbi:hypothetical protein [Gloeothece verrucosa]|uniref:Uncharacterized protein n=1 Tax=Gloeothece verrucosa (strain PCC 7822) TaxID=497965 RepID=E0UAH1_GLOV7|nr:hypothetical protein [Gloeothece verrucosa]ADN12712.1 hypothetical protein Cyan7822_0676 [Gloeothece verrucosa PCC 7822]